MEPKFTKGPWKIDRETTHAGVVDGEYHSIQAGRGCGGDGFSIAEFMSTADRDLIAAAPELYEALETAQRVLSDLVRGHATESIAHVWAHCVEAELKARKALAKARGER